MGTPSNTRGRKWPGEHDPDQSDVALAYERPDAKMLSNFKHALLASSDVNATQDWPLRASLRDLVPSILASSTRSLPADKDSNGILTTTTPSLLLPSNVFHYCSNPMDWIDG